MQFRRDGIRFGDIYPNSELPPGAVIFVLFCAMATRTGSTIGAMMTPVTASN